MRKDIYKVEYKIRKSKGYILKIIRNVYAESIAQIEQRVKETSHAKGENILVDTIKY